jgi:hypothetical protein
MMVRCESVTRAAVDFKVKDDVLQRLSLEYHEARIRVS